MSRITHAELLDRSQLLDPLADLKGAIAACQQTISHGKTLLAEYHLEGGNAAVLARHHTWLLDQLLVFHWKHFVASSPDSGDQADSPSLIAAGGYSRQELNLESDIDLLLLLSDNVTGKESAVLGSCEQFIQFCWDIGLKIGHSIRTTRECIDIARQDLTVMTNLMETRLLHGNSEACEKLQDKLRKGRIWPINRFFSLKLAEQEARHLHYGDTAYNLEPNIKESKGGLRDLHMISWVANRYFGTSDLGELVEHGFLTESEYKSLIRHRDFLWRLRNGLHYLSGRCEDRLLFDFQQQLARQLGYEQGENHLAVEQMMKAYYRTAKEMQFLNELLLQHFQEAILHPTKLRERPINQRFRAVGNYLEATSDTLFSDHPAAMLEVFLLLQRRPALRGIRASTIRQLRANLGLINDSYRKNPEHRKIFLDIFRHQTGLTHALRRMSAYGLLGAFFPAFGNVVGQMQHDLFHIYTVDAHSLFVVANLRRLDSSKYEDEFPELSKLLGRQNNRERLYLAALCHDIGKGSGRDHSEVGEEIALKFCGELGLSDYDAEFAGWLVRQHLTMSWVAQREDITDPRVVDRFAEVVGDQEHLDNLYLLTFADIRGTSPKVWSEWKGKLLENLYNATSRRLRTGISGEMAVAERIEARKVAIRKLMPRRMRGEILDQLWAQLDQEYFLRNGPGTGAWHAEVMASAGVIDLPLVSGRNRKDIAAMQLLVLAPETNQLLPIVTGSLDRLSLNILDARIHSTHSGLSLLAFIVADPGNASASKGWLSQTTDDLRNFLLSGQEPGKPTKRMLPRTLKQFSVKTMVSFSDAGALGYTIMEIVSQDRPGLLYQVARALSECRVKLVSAKGSTVGERAEDTFFITDRDGNPVNTEQQQNCLVSRLKEALD